MKKCIVWLLTPIFYLLSLFPFTVRLTQADETVHAVGSYACILTNAYFYTQPDEQSGLFLLPQTYFVKTLEYLDTFCKIEYLYDDEHVAKLIGYAKTNELTFVDFIPERPYLYHLFEVSYTLEKSTAEQSPKQENILQEIKFTCAYYGDYPIGSQTYCYVLRDNKFGYIPKPETLVIEPNGEYAAHQTPEEPPLTIEENTSPNGVQIAILIALCLLVPILAAFIFKSPRRPPYDIDEN